MAFDIKEKALKEALKKSEKEKYDNKPGNSRQDEIEADLNKLVPPMEPAPKRYYIGDSTTEKIAELLIPNPQGLLLHSDELVGWLASFEKQGRETDRAFYLSAWAGDIKNYPIDRIGRGSKNVPNLCLSIVGTIQPAKLLGYLNEAMSLTGNDGLIQRLQLMAYPDKIPNWKNVDENPDSQAYIQAEKIYRNFATLTEGLSAFHFSDDAQQ